MKIGRSTLQDWNKATYEIKSGDTVSDYQYLPLEMLQLFNAREIDENALVRLVPLAQLYGVSGGLDEAEWKKLSETNLFKSFPQLRQLTTTRLNMLMLEELEKFRTRFLWWSVGTGIILASFFLFGVRVWIASRS